MLKLATLIDNPGEPLPDTRYRDPAYLKQLGYTGLVLFETTSLSGIASPENVSSGELRRWVEHQFEAVTKTLEQAHAAGLAAFIFYDVLSLPRQVVERETRLVTCKNRPRTICPGSERALELSLLALDNMLARWSEAAGVVLRLGDNDAARFPYLIGNEIYSPYCPRCSSLSKVDRVAQFAQAFYDLVVQKHHRKLILRAWNVRPRGMHDQPDLAAEIAQRLPGSPDDQSLIVSFKFTETDFWRYQRWNQSSLEMQGRPVLYELQCQREFEGKGGIPNWQVPLWTQGAPECADRETVHGLADAAKRVNLAGLWAWVRGGGWGGPFISHERWIDANVVAVPRLADDPSLDPAPLAHDWIEQRLGITDEDAKAVILRVLEHSSANVLRGFYVAAYARSREDAWHPNGDWIQDDQLDARAAWRMIQKLPDDRLDEVVEEKKQAAAQVTADRAELHKILNRRNQNVIEPMVNSMIYLESFYETLRDLLAGLVAYRRYLKTRDAANAQQCQRKLLQAQAHWNHHVQRHATLHGAATAFREAHFWDLTQQILTELQAAPTA